MKKKIIFLFVILVFMISGAGLAMAENQAETNQTKKEAIKEKQEEFRELKLEYQKLKDLRNQLNKVRKEYNSKMLELKKLAKFSKDNKEKDKVKIAFEDIKGIRVLIKERGIGFAIGKQEIKELEEARVNKDIKKSQVIVKVSEQNLIERINLIKQIITQLDKAIADLK